jgi:hypothetical protein
MRDHYTLDIDHDLRDWLPGVEENLPNEELERQIIEEEGAIHAIVVWKEKNVIVDGHRRYGYCKKHSLPFPIHYKSFKSKDEAKHWMDRFQIARRNLSAHEKALVLARMFAVENQSLPTTKAVAKVAADAGVADRTVSRAVQYEKALAALPPEVKKMLDDKKIEASHKDVVELSGYPVERQKHILGELISGEYASIGAVLHGEGNEDGEADDTDKVSVKKKQDWNLVRKHAMKHAESLQRTVYDLHDLKPSATNRDRAYNHAVNALKILEGWA